MTAALTLAVAAGALAAFNPCGFALLPGYLALFLGDSRDRKRAVARALVVGLSVTSGFVLVFGAAGVAVTALSLTLGDWLSYVTMASGALLIVVGGYLLTGREASVRLPRARLGIDGSPRGMLAYGVVYATVSLSCTLPVFLAAVVSTFTLTGETASPALGVLALLGYAAGMGAVLVVLALVTALFGAGAAARLRAATPRITRVSAVFLLVAGAYVLWYGWVEYQAFQGVLITGGPVGWVSGASSAISRVLASVPGGVLLGLAAGVLTLAVAACGRGRAVTARRAPGGRGRRRPRPDPPLSRPVRGPTRLWVSGPR